MADEKKGGKVIRVNFKENLIGVEPEAQAVQTNPTNNINPLTASVVATAMVPVLMAGPAASFLDNKNHIKVNDDESKAPNIEQLSVLPKHMRASPSDLMEQFRASQGDGHAGRIRQSDDSEKHR